MSTHLQVHDGSQRQWRLASAHPEFDVPTMLLERSGTVGEAIRAIDKNAMGIVLVVEEDDRLVDTVTDGDIRRAILSGCTLETTLGDLVDEKARSKSKEPITARCGVTDEDLRAMMQKHVIHHVPIVDDAGRVHDLATADALFGTSSKASAVIMAGGFGSRLRPLTLHTPKPMLPVGNRPIMEVAVARLERAGIKNINVTTHYLPEKIREHFGDGSRFGVDLTYVNEVNPLGTAGFLQLLDDWDEPLLVLNGDILTDVNFRSLISYHHEHAATLTVAVRKYDFRVPYGVVNNQGGLVTTIEEKPSYSFYVNAGIYLLEPSVKSYIVPGERLDMPDLIRSLIADGRTVAGFPILEYWLDIGQPVDYEKAQADVREGRVAA